MKKSPPKPQVKNPAKGAAKKGVNRPTLWDQITQLPWVAALLAAAILLVYVRTLSYYTGKFDEDLLIFNNIQILSDFSNLGLVFERDAFLSLQGSEFYRPFQNITFMIDAHLGGTDGWAWYLTNMILHFGGCLSLFYLMTLLKVGRGAALLLSMIFAVNPLFVSAIPWAPARGDLLTGLLIPLALIFYILYTRERSWKYLLAGQLTILLAIFSKETAILIPVILLLFMLAEWRSGGMAEWRNGGMAEWRSGGVAESWKRPPHPHTLIPSYLYLALSLLSITLYLVLRMRVVNPENSVDAYGLVPFLENLRTIPEMLSKFVFPLNLAPMAGFSWTATITGSLLIILLVILILRRRKEEGFFLLLFGAAWFLLFLAPSLPYRHVMGSAAYDYLEHRSYLPLMGLILVAGILLTPLFDRKWPTWLPWGMMAYLITTGFLAWQYLPVYENPLTFYNQAIEANPGSALALSNRGIIRQNTGDLPGALADHEAALKIYPVYPKALVNRANVLDLMKQPDAAEKGYREAIRLDSGLYQAHYNLANLLFTQQRYDEAMEEYQASIRLNQAMATAMNNIGVILMMRSDTAGAVDWFTRAIGADPSVTQPLLNRGKIYFNSQNKEKACTDWAEAARKGDQEAAGLLRQYCNP